MNSVDGHSMLDRFTSFFNSQTKLPAKSQSSDKKSPTASKPKIVVRTSEFYEVSSLSSAESNWDEADSINESIPDISISKPDETLPKPTLKDLIEAEINYILETEDKYSKMLLSLEKDREDLATISPPFFRKWLSQLFRQIKPLAIMHETLLTSLGSARCDIKKFCESFLDMKKQLYSYIYYIENIPTVDKLIAEYSSFLKEQKPDLIDKLRQPRLRLNHYVLMLESLQKKVKEEEKSHLQSVIDLCKKYLTEADKALLLGTISGCPFHLSECGRIVHKSDLKLIDSPDLPRNMHHVVLLQRKMLLLSGNMDKYRFVQSIQVDDMSLKSTARGLYFSILINKNEKGFAPKYIFKAKNIKLQQTWLKKLKETINEVRTSFIRNVNQASFGRSGRKLRKLFSIPKPIKTSFVSDPENSDSDEASKKQYWLDRRKLKKKYATFSVKETAGPKRRQNAGLSDEDEKSNRIDNDMAPLTVWNFFEILEYIYKYLRDDKMLHKNAIANISSSTLDDENKCRVINISERKYVDYLEKTSESFQDEATPKPPKEIRADIRRLFEFHSKEILPAYDDCDDITEQFLESLTSHGEEFAVLYSEYLIDRCTYHYEISEMNLTDPYTNPMNHFILYCQCILSLRYEEHGQTFSKDLINTAAKILHDTITNANNYLLAESINNVPFALSQCEPILQVGRLKMRCDGKSRQEYQVVLVKDQLIILEQRPPLYNYCCSLRLESVCLGPSADPYHFQLEYQASAFVKKVYSFWASRKDLCDAWKEEIRELLILQALILKNKIQQRLEVAPTLNVGQATCLQNHTVDISKSPNIQKKATQIDLLQTDL